MTTPDVRWVCTKCANDQPTTVRIDPTRPAVDALDRYAIGFCDECTPARMGVHGLGRERVALEASTHFDRAKFNARKEAEADARLLAKHRLGHVLKPVEQERIKAIVARQHAREDVREWW